MVRNIILSKLSAVLEFAPDHFVDDADVGLNALHDLGGDILIHIVGDRKAVLACTLFGCMLHHSNNPFDNVIHIGKVTLYLVVAKTPFSEKIYLLCPRSISSIADEIYLL